MDLLRCTRELIGVSRSREDGTLRPMVLHVVYRVYSGENQKPRPVGYSKGSCFQSLLVALEHIDDEFRVVIVADGRVPLDVEALIQPAFCVTTISGGRPSTSMRSALKIATNLARAAAPGDAFWICEDDYVYRRDAMKQLMSVLQAAEWCDYVTLFVPRPTSWHSTHKSQPEVLVQDQRLVSQNDTVWVRVGSTTATFGVGREALLKDRWALALATRAGSPWDCAAWASLQGIRPYPLRYVFRNLDARSGVRGILKVVAKPVMRVLVDLVALARNKSGRRLFAPHENLAVHAEAYEVDNLAIWGVDDKRQRPTL